MAIHNFAILNAIFVFNFINNNKQVVGNWIHVPNTYPSPITDPLKFEL